MLVGAIRLRRFSCYGERCQLGTTPLEEMLQVTARRTQLVVQKAAVQLAKELSDQTVCEIFKELTGLPRSAPIAHEVTQVVAAGVTVLEVAPSREEITAKIEAIC